VRDRVIVPMLRAYLPSSAVLTVPATPCGFSMRKSKHAAARARKRVKSGATAQPSRPGCRQPVVAGRRRPAGFAPIDDGRVRPALAGTVLNGSDESTTRASWPRSTRKSPGNGALCTERVRSLSQGMKVLFLSSGTPRKAELIPDVAHATPHPVADPDARRRENAESAGEQRATQNNHANP
jgi:hypothetical protein